MKDVTSSKGLKGSGGKAFSERKGVADLGSRMVPDLFTPFPAVDFTVCCNVNPTALLLRGHRVTARSMRDEKHMVCFVWQGAFAVHKCMYSFNLQVHKRGLSGNCLTKAPAPVMVYFHLFTNTNLVGFIFTPPCYLATSPFPLHIPMPTRLLHPPRWIRPCASHV